MDRNVDKAWFAEVGIIAPVQVRGSKFIQKITSTRTSVGHTPHGCVDLNGIEDNEKKYPESRTSTGVWVEIISVYLKS